MQTAAPLAARLGLEPIVERDLREVHLGEWEGELYRQRVAEGHPIAMQMITEERWDVIPGAESADSLRERVGGALRRIVAAHAGQRVVVVAHGGVIAEIMAQVADTRRAFAFLGCDNASISHVVSFGDRWILRRFNDTSHLDGDLDRRRTSTPIPDCPRPELSPHSRGLRPRTPSPMARWRSLTRPASKTQPSPR